MKNMRPLLVSYDIRSDKIRRRVCRIIRDWRLGGQKSVHECRLAKHHAEELFLQLAEDLDHSCDDLILVWVAQRRPVLLRGRAENNLLGDTLFGG